MGIIYSFLEAGRTSSKFEEAALDVIFGYVIVACHLEGMHFFVFIVFALMRVRCRRRSTGSKDPRSYDVSVSDIFHV